MNNKNHSELWEHYLLYAILKRVVKNTNALDEVVRRFGCHPDQMLEDARFWDRHHYEEIEEHGYLRFDDDRGWLFSWNVNFPIKYWDEVLIANEITVGYDAFIQKVHEDPDAAANTAFRVGMRQDSISPALVWSREKVEVGGTPAAITYIVDDETWELCRLVENPSVKAALISDFLQMKPNIADTIKRFLTEPLFFDSVLSFLGFAASSNANIWREYHRENMSLLIEAFNAASIAMGCKDVTECDIKPILTIVGSRIGAFYDFELDIPEVHPVLVKWSLLNRCSIFGPGMTFLEILPHFPMSMRLFPEALVWCTTKTEQAEIAHAILTRLKDGHYHRRYVEALIALTLHSEPFHPDLQEAIMDYLFCQDPDRYAYERKTFSDLLGFGYMSEQAKMKVLSLLEVR